MISLRELEIADIGLLHRWLNAGEVLRWYGHGQLCSIESVRAMYFDGANPLTHRRIVVDSERPVGYLQWYRVADYPEYAKEMGALPGDYGLDLFIGEDESVGKGLGRRVLQLALTKLIFTKRDAIRCVLGPTPENQRAIRCYESCGFRHLYTIKTDEGEEYIMAVPRSCANAQQGGQPDAFGAGYL